MNFLYFLCSRYNIIKLMIIYDKNIINLIDFADKMKDNVYNKMI